MSCVEVAVVEARRLRPVSITRTCDAYAVVEVSGCGTDSKTHTIYGTTSPAWGMHWLPFTINDADVIKALTVEVAVMDESTDSALGKGILHVTEDEIDEWMPLSAGEGEVRICVRPAEGESRSTQAPEQFSMDRLLFELASLAAMIRPAVTAAHQIADLTSWRCQLTSAVALLVCLLLSSMPWMALSLFPIWIAWEIVWIHLRAVATPGERREEETPDTEVMLVLVHQWARSINILLRHVSAILLWKDAQFSWMVVATLVALSACLTVLPMRMCLSIFVLGVFFVRSRNSSARTLLAGMYSAMLPQLESVFPESTALKRLRSWGGPP